jgi:hypothetical protein
VLKEYLQVEWAVKKGGSELSKASIKGCVPKVPQQTNFSDCGVYMLQYVESFFEVSCQVYCDKHPNIKEKNGSYIVITSKLEKLKPKCIAEKHLQIIYIKNSEVYKELSTLSFHLQVRKWKSQKYY